MPTNNDASIRLAEKHAALLAALLDDIDRLNKELAAILAALHDGALALRVGAEATDLGQDCDTAIRWYRQAVLDAGKKD